MLADAFPNAAQVRALGLDQAGDDVIWDFALREGFTIVTLDADFAEIATLRGAPPKVVWLRCGNQATAVVARLLRDRAASISSFSQDAEAACLELY